LDKKQITSITFADISKAFENKICIDLLNNKDSGFAISFFTANNIRLLIISWHINKLLYKFQSGFLLGFSTTHQLIELYDTILLALDKKQITSTTFADISKAFDTVWIKAYCLLRHL
jgi:hypothetical protein